MYHLYKLVPLKWSDRYCLCVRVPFVAVRGAYILFHCTYIVRNFKWFCYVILMTYFLEEIDFNGLLYAHSFEGTYQGSASDCRAQSEARSRNPSLVPGQGGWNDLPLRPPPAEERVWLGRELGKCNRMIFSRPRLCSCRHGWDDEVMCEFLMFFGRLWLTIICFSGSSFVPQMRPRRPHR